MSLNRFTFPTVDKPRIPSPESHRRPPLSSTAVLFSTDRVHRTSSGSHPEPPTTWLTESKASIVIYVALASPSESVIDLFEIHPTHQSRHKKTQTHKRKFEPKAGDAMLKESPPLRVISRRQTELKEPRRSGVKKPISWHQKQKRDPMISLLWTCNEKEKKNIYTGPTVAVKAHSIGRRHFSHRKESREKSEVSREIFLL